MPGRQYTSATAYRYGFNGKENDNDVKGIQGSQQDYGFRIYDPRLGKFLSVDPLESFYPFYSTYQFAGNTPIQAIDLDGLEPMLPMPGGAYTPPSDQIQKPIKDLNAIKYLENKSAGAFERSQASTSATLDFIPVVGTLKGWAEAVTGSDLITGEEIPTWVRVASIVPYGKIASKGKVLLKHSDEVLKFSENVIPKIVKHNPCGCFDGKTIVITSEGNKYIENVKIGDLVLSFSETDNKIQYQKVLTTNQIVRDTILELYFGTEKLLVTTDHPFYFEGRWIEANKLSQESSYLFNRNGDKVKIDSILIRIGSFVVFNFEVEKNHNYYVSTAQILVHNGTCEILKSGFYKILKKGETIYVGKGNIEKRAAKSMANKAGDSYKYIEVTEGVAGLSVEKTAFVYEYLLMKKSGGLSKLENAIESPGKKYYEDLLDDKGKELIESVFNKISKEIE